MIEKKALISDFHIKKKTAKKIQKKKKKKQNIYYRCKTYKAYLGPFALRIGEMVKNTQFGVYPFRCKVYVHCICCVYGHSGVDSKGKLYTFCTLC